MAAYSQNVLDEIKSNTDISNIIERFVPLKKQGARWVGVCPFHDDHSPSMNVNPAMGIYKCFACGAGGDVFRFLMDHEKFSFMESVQWVAREINYPLPQTEESATGRIQRENRERLARANEFAATWFSEQLKAEQSVLKYLADRGVNHESMQELRLGWAPESWDGLMGAAAKQGISRQDLVDAGLAVEKETGRAFDRFRGRLIFPVCNLAGKVIAFGGRLIGDAQGPKYLNSPETELYHKSDVLYGLNLSRGDISRNGEAIFVEGYFDFLQLWQHGIRNAAAVSGTALTSTHAKLLRRFASRCFLVFDGDEAGVKAARRSIEVLLPTGIEIRVLLLPQGEDPDSLVKNQGPEAFRQRLERSLNFVDFLLQQENWSSATPEHRSEVSRVLKGWLGLIQDPVIRNSYQELASDRMSIKMRHLEPSSTVISHEHHPYPQEAPNPAPRHHVPGFERRFAALVLYHPAVRGLSFQLLDPELLEQSQLGELIDHALVLLEDHAEIRAELLYDRLPESMRDILSSIEPEPCDDETAVRIFTETYLRLKTSLVKQQMQQLRSELGEHDQALQEYLSLKQEVNQLENITRKIRLSELSPLEFLEQELEAKP